VKLRLFQELLDLNQAFEQVLRGLERMEKVPLFHAEELRYARAVVESARLQANRQFYARFEELVEKDAVWAHEFRYAYEQKLRDPFDLYLEVKEHEEARKKKGLPPRVVLLPDWDKDDEQRFDEERAKKRKRAATKRRKTTRKHTRNARKPPTIAQADVTSTPERKTES
jgi:hypothetical protein